MTIQAMLGALVGIIISICGLNFIKLFKKDKKIDYNPEDSIKDIELTPDEDKEVVEATYEIIKEEHLQDEQFENTVTRLRTEVSNLSDSDLADSINELLGESEPNPIATTKDKSKFEWERNPS